MLLSDLLCIFHFLFARVNSASLRFGLIYEFLYQREDLFFHNPAFFSMITVVPQEVQGAVFVSVLQFEVQGHLKFLLSQSNFCFSKASFSLSKVNLSFSKASFSFSNWLAQDVTKSIKIENRIVFILTPNQIKDLRKKTFVQSFFLHL